ncbi:MAG: DUF928 domain-containing protein [Myxococcales bacterium]|nr:DUF928 domain-containing protein [Myxococcales bacterium]
MRPRSNRGIIALALTALLLPAAAVAEEEPAQQPSSEEAPAADAAKGEDPKPAPEVSAAPMTVPVYIPPKRSRPARTAGGATRGRSDRIPSLWVLVPDHVGQTVSDEPDLLWFVDTLPPAGMQLRFTLMDEDAIEPNAEILLPRPTQPGIQRIRLADHGVKLDVGLEYEWSVSLALDPDDPAKDVVATGWIDRVERSPQLTEQLARDGDAQAAHVYAQNGLWYDALAATHQRVEKSPADAQARQAQAKLLDQVGLDATTETR